MKKEKLKTPKSGVVVSAQTIEHPFLKGQSLTSITIHDIDKDEKRYHFIEGLYSFYVGEFIGCNLAISYLNKNGRGGTIYSRNRVALRWLYAGKSNSTAYHKMNQDEIDRLVDSSERLLKYKPKEIDFQYWDFQKFGSNPAYIEDPIEFYEDVLQYKYARRIPIWEAANS